ncbi:hypothetical protein GIB67_030624, partial [Kingdonia uniflora]
HQRKPENEEAFLVYHAMGFPRSKSVTEREQRIPRTSLQTTDVQSSQKKTQGVSVQSQLQSSNRMANNSPALPMSLPGKLSIHGKEAMQNKETGQKVALQALRDASATKFSLGSQNLLIFEQISKNGCFKRRISSDLSISTRADAPSAYFDQFLEFHQHIMEVISYLESVQAATCLDVARPH